MSFGPGFGDPPNPSGGLLASEADREAAQSVLKTAFEEQRLTQEEFESRVGRAIAARTQAELAGLTRDLPAVRGEPARAGRRARRVWLVAAGCAVVLALVAVGIVRALSPGSGQPAAAPARAARNAGPASSGAAGCPVGTSATALAIASALAASAVYADPASSLLTGDQVQRLQTKIARENPGRIRIAAVAPSTLRSGGGARALTNAIASCRADAAGTTLVTTSGTSYVVTSYSAYSAAAQAVQAALNTHASLAAGLLDAVGRITIVDNGG